MSLIAEKEERARVLAKELDRVQALIKQKESEIKQQIDTMSVQIVRLYKMELTSLRKREKDCNRKIKKMEDRQDGSR
jgi:cell division protein FtsB